MREEGHHLEHEDELWRRDECSEPPLCDDEHLSHLQSVITWIPISERLPDVYDPVFVLIRYEESKTAWDMAVAAIDEESEWALGGTGEDLHSLYLYYGGHVTHWAELPALPTSKE